MTACELRQRISTMDLVFDHDPDRQRAEWEAIARAAVSYAMSVERDLVRLADMIGERDGGT